MEKQQPKKANVYNVATGKAIDINSLANLINKIMQKKIRPIHVDPRKGDIALSQGDPTLAYEKLGIKTKYTLRQGLIKLINSR